jgi:hypothetical protein
MGYILCKPFFDDLDVKEPANEEAYLEIKYQMVLLEIKRIKNKYEAGAIPEDEYKAQLSKMKKEAVNLLRLLDLEPTELQNIFPQEDVLFEPPEDDVEKYCPQCGEHIETIDKFCMHCGHNL